jgi:mannose-6-phosphate isomerase-like protein (cupin superfamily)
MPDNKSFAVLFSCALACAGSSFGACVADDFSRDILGPQWTWNKGAVPDKSDTDSTYYMTGSAFRHTAEPGADSGPALTHEGEDIVVVLNGQLSIEIAGTWHDLKAGDSIYFNSALSHRWCNRRKQAAQAIWESSPPYF